MIFQYYYGGGLSNVFYYLEQWGIRDVILPFILIFTIIFAIMQKTNLLKEKKYNLVVALAIALLTVIPHVTRSYPPGMDIVEIINNAVPGVALVLVIIVMVLILVGLLGSKEAGIWTAWILGALGILAIIGFFISSIRPVPILSQIDPALQTLIIVLIMFGLIVWFITSEKTTPSEKEKQAFIEKAWKGIFGEPKP